MSRILLLSAELRGVGGVERLLATLSVLLSAEHEVHVASFDPPDPAPGVPLLAPFHPLGGDPPRPLPLRPLTYLSQARRLRAVERRLAIDVTVSNLWRADLVSVLAGGQVRRVALAHINVVGNATNQLMVRLRLPVAAIYRRFDRVVTVSAALARELTALYRLDPAKVRTIWNPVAAPAAPPPPDDRQRIVWCGRMVAEKNLPALIDIFAAVKARHPAATLHLIGDGPERALVEARAAANGLATGGDGAAVTLHGVQGEPAAVMAGAAVLALPSIAEGFGLVLVEAMAQGVPVAAADCSSGGVHEVLAAASRHDPARADGEEVGCGWLLPVPRDAASRDRWVDALDLLLADYARHDRYRRGATARAADFAPAHAAARWRSLLAGLRA